MTFFPGLSRFPNTRAALWLTNERLTCNHKFFLLYSIDLRVSESEVLQRFYNSRRDDEPCEPLVVGRHHVPWRMLRRSCPDRFLKCLHVVIPVVTLLNIGTRELPIFLRRVEAFHEALFLLLARHVQEELEDDRALPGEIILEIGDIGETLIPDSLVNATLRKLFLSQDFWVHAHDENLLVIRTVENSDTPAFGQALDVAPQEVVIEIL